MNRYQVGIDCISKIACVNLWVLKRRQYYWELSNEFFINQTWFWYELPGLNLMTSHSQPVQKVTHLGRHSSDRFRYGQTRLSLMTSHPRLFNGNTATGFGPLISSQFIM